MVNSSNEKWVYLLDGDLLYRLMHDHKEFRSADNAGKCMCVRW